MPARRTPHSTLQTDTETLHSAAGDLRVQWRRSRRARRVSLRIDPRSGTVVLTLPPMKNNKSEFQVNGVPFWKAKPYTAKLGEKQLWIVKNESDWDHPFHLHGFFFHVIDDNGQPVRPLALKDTVNVPMKSTLRLLVTFDERPGEWMFHCHILDHADGGLMGTVLVGDVKPATHVHKQ